MMGDENNFIAEFESMDLTELQDKQFIVAVNTGSRDECKLLASTIKGPFEFVEMCEEVGTMWEKQQHHAKVTVLSTDTNTPTVFLDENTTDYLEAHWSDIVANSIIEGALGQIDFTCKANMITGRENNEETVEQRIVEEKGKI